MRFSKSFPIYLVAAYGMAAEAQSLSTQEKQQMIQNAETINREHTLKTRRKSKTNNQSLAPQAALAEAHPAQTQIRSILDQLESGEMGAGKTLPANDFRFEARRNHGYWAAEILTRSGALSADERAELGAKAGNIGELIEFLRTRKLWEECPRPTPGGLSYIWTPEGIANRTNALGFVGRDLVSRYSVFGEQVLKFSSEDPNRSPKLHILTNDTAGTYKLHRSSHQEALDLPLKFLVPPETCFAKKAK